MRQANKSYLKEEGVGGRREGLLKRTRGRTVGVRPVSLLKGRQSRRQVKKVVKRKEG